MDGCRHGLTDPQWKILKPLMEQVGGTKGRKPPAGSADILQAFVDSTVSKAAPCAAGALKKSKALLRAVRVKSPARAGAA
ncbi:MAG: hypothetical protein EAZ34_02965 [Polaromonas sp.]|nr:MAG: hypothetical protein EAZ34_02965 [Polaromonas sp.]